MGMTEKGARVWREEGGKGGWCWSRRDTRGKRGYDEVGGAGMTREVGVWRRKGAVGRARGGRQGGWRWSRRDTRGKRGYDEVGGAGMTREVGVWRRKGAVGRARGGRQGGWRWSRRDTRDKRGYDGVGGAGMTRRWGAGMTGEGARVCDGVGVGAGMTGKAAVRMWRLVRPLLPRPRRLRWFWDPRPRAWRRARSGASALLRRFR